MIRTLLKSWWRGGEKTAIVLGKTPLSGGEADTASRRKGDSLTTA